MHTYTDIDQFVGSISMVDDSDSPTATNFNTPNEALADRTRYLLSQSGAFDTWIVGADADTTYTRQRRRTVVRVAPTALSANRTYTLGNTGAVTGDLFEVINTALVYHVTVKSAPGTVLDVLGDTHQNTSEAFEAGGRHGIFIFNGVDWDLLYSAQNGLLMKEFLADGSWVVPANYTGIALAIGCGGGGGGGGGCGQNATTGNFTTGGGGGAAGIQSVAPIFVFAEETLTITIGGPGVGGTGGAAATNGSIGGDGGHTSIVRSATTIARFHGGRGGQGGIRYTGSGTPLLASGGSRGNFAFPASGTALVNFIALPASGNIMLSPGDGGPGAPNFYTTRSGDGGYQGFDYNGTAVSGSGGLHGANDTSSQGGGGGGGGAQGPFGNGGNGGVGGAGLAGGPPGNGASGSSVSANSGAGGGGGGGGGAGSGGSTGGDGGNGGSGRLFILIPR